MVNRYARSVRLDITRIHLAVRSALQGVFRKVYLFYVVASSAYSFLVFIGIYLVLHGLLGLCDADRFSDSTACLTIQKFRKSSSSALKETANRLRRHVVKEQINW